MNIPHTSSHRAKNGFIPRAYFAAILSNLGKLFLVGVNWTLNLLNIGVISVTNDPTSALSIALASNGSINLENQLNKSSSEMES